MAKKSSGFIVTPSESPARPTSNFAPTGRDCKYNGETIPGVNLERRSAGASGPVEVVKQNQPVHGLPTNLIEHKGD